MEMRRPFLYVRVCPLIGNDSFPTMRRFLLICSRNRLRSPTAEHIFSSHPGVEVASAGLDRDAENPLTSDLLEWADTIFVMEKVHRRRLASRFRPHLNGKRIICLDIPDNYEFMDPELVRVLKARMQRFIPSA